MESSRVNNLVIRALQYGAFLGIVLFTYYNLLIKGSINLGYAEKIDYNVSLTVISGQNSSEVPLVLAKLKSLFELKFNYDSYGFKSYWGAVAILTVIFLLALNDVFSQGRRKAVEATILPPRDPAKTIKDLIDKSRSEGADAQHLVVILLAVFYGGGLVPTVRDLSSTNIVVSLVIFA